MSVTAPTATSNPSHRRPPLRPFQGPFDVADRPGFDGPARQEILQFVFQFGRRCVTLFWVFLQALLRDRRQVARHRWVDGTHSARFVELNLLH